MTVILTVAVIFLLIVSLMLTTCFVLFSRQLSQFNYQLVEELSELNQTLISRNNSQPIDQELKSLHEALLMTSQALVEFEATSGGRQRDVESRLKEIELSLADIPVKEIGFDEGINFDEVIQLLESRSKEEQSLQETEDEVINVTIVKHDEVEEHDTIENKEQEVDSEQDAEVEDVQEQSLDSDRQD